MRKAIPAVGLGERVLFFAVGAASPHAKSLTHRGGPEKKRPQQKQHPQQKTARVPSDSSLRFMLNTDQRDLPNVDDPHLAGPIPQYRAKFVKPSEMR